MPKKRKAPPQPVELPDDEKLALLNSHAIIGPGWESLDETRWCLHCEKIFTGRAVRVYPDSHFPEGYCVECGTPGCDGSPIDWHEEGSPFQEQSEAREPEEPSDVDEGELDAENDEVAEGCGEYGPQIQIVPVYRDDAQRSRLRSLFWQGKALGQRYAEPNAEFSETLCSAAKAALAERMAERFGVEKLKKAQIYLPARLEGMEADPGFDMPECFHLEVEYASGVGDEEYSEEFSHALMSLIDEDDTETALLTEVRLAIANYLAEHVAIGEELSWNVEITGYGGG